MHGLRERHSQVIHNYASYLLVYQFLFSPCVHGQLGSWYLVNASVSLLTCFLTLHSTRSIKSDANRFSALRTGVLKSVETK